MANLSHLSIYLKDLKIARRSLKQRRFREGREQFNLFMDGLDRFPEGELPISYTKYLDDFIHQKVCLFVCLFV